MKKFKPTIVGIVIGILLFVILTFSIGYNAFNKLEKDYGDEAKKLVEVLNASKEPVFQEDYILAGLNLSPQFKMYLAKGIEKGWWTEEYITQVALDDLLPIYVKQFSDVFKLLAETEKGEKVINAINAIKEKYPEIEEYIKSLDINKIKGTLYKLRDAFMSLDINRLILQIQSIKDMLSKLDKDQIESMINKIKDLITNIKIILNKYDLDEIKDKINEIKNQIEELKLKLTYYINKIKDWLDNLDLDKLENILTKLEDILGDVDWDHVRHEIHKFLYNLKIKIETILGDIDEFIYNIRALIHRILNLINNIIPILYNYIFQNLDNDYNFVNSVTIAGKEIPAEVLNGIDIHITRYFDPGTSPWFTDDTLYINSISISPEVTMAGEGQGIRFVKVFDATDPNGKSVPNIPVPTTGMNVVEIIDWINQNV